MNNQTKADPSIIYEVAFAIDCLCGKLIYCNMDDDQEIREISCSDCGRVITVSFNITIYIQKETYQAS